ncbi:MAG: ABC transporter permease [Chloroflexi bacterium]|nr:ABC transporter permease [Chloroflexota bacterium]
MRAYLVRRLLQLAPVVLLILAINFTLIQLAPGDPVLILAGDSGNETYYAEMRAKYGLDRPAYEQFARYVLNILRGDFGYSFRYGQPVFAVILERVPATLLLMLTAQTIAIIVGIGLGMIAGSRPSGNLGLFIRTGAALGYALPVFWIGQLSILFFAYQLGWFPVYGMESLRAGYTGIARVFDIAHHLALPALTLAVVEIGLLVRLTDATLRDLSGEDFARTARAKGLRETIVVRRHILRNALLPVVTAIGGQLGALLTGAVLVEIVFAWPGLGRLLYDAMLARDYPLLMAMFLVSAFGVVIGNLITDLLYTRIDPRVRFEAR